MERIVLLGASGSIGKQTLDVITNNPNDFELVGFSVGNHVDYINEILSSHPGVQCICVKNSSDANSFHNVKTFYGDDGLLSLIDECKPTLVVNALVGFVGLVPTIHSLKNGYDVALANKESIVVGGELINSILKSSSVHLYPIDSEHVALAKCLHGNESEVERLVLTASGGAFRELNREQLLNVTKEDALKHPSWQMGNKITIDCATMMNKGFELIEAHYLFNTPMDKIDILIHYESKIHSMVFLKDGSYLADIGPADMRLPISYALYRGKRNYGVSKMSLQDFASFTFKPFITERYPCVQYAREAIANGGVMPAVLNAANEIAVNAFLNDEIKFLDIERVIEKCLSKSSNIANPSLEQLIMVDKETRLLALNIIKEEL